MINKNKFPKEWYQENKEEIKKKRKVYYQNNKEEIKLKHTAYHRSHYGYALSLYRGIISRIKNDKNYKNVTLHFTKEEFINFLKNSNYNELHQEWIDNEYNFLFSPSVDRINPRKNYSLDNIQLLTIKENVTKSNLQRRTCPSCNHTW